MPRAREPGARCRGCTVSPNPLAVHYHQGAPPAPSRTLYDLEENIVDLLDTEELVPPDQESEFKQQLARALVDAVDKRDRIAQFLAHCECQAAFAGLEIKRLQERKARFTRAAERLEAYVIWVIQSLRVKQLEGKHITLSLARCPSSVAIERADKVPCDYQSFTPKLPWARWAEILNALPQDERVRLLSELNVSESQIDKLAVKEALAAGVEVPGARLVTDKQRLVRK